MSDNRYSYDVSLDDLNTSHSLAVLSVPPGSTVLDVGAADGAVARALVERGCRVWGIEIEDRWAQQARRFCEAVVTADVEQIQLASVFAGQHFDRVLLLDVLEHLREPQRVLEQVHGVLAPSGRVIASIPNITHAAVRVSLMQGTFTYTETGLLDRTHLRFFDRAAVDALFRSARFSIVERLRVERGLTETEIRVDESSVPPSILESLSQDPDATTYQFIVEASPADRTPAPPHPASTLSERLQQQVSDHRAQYRQLESYTKRLELQLDEQTASLQASREENQQLARALGEARLSREQLRLTQVDAEHSRKQLAEKAAELEGVRACHAELTSELTARMHELRQRHEDMRHMRADLAVKEALVVHLRELLASRERTEGAVREELQHTGNELEQTKAYASSPGFRLVEKVSLRLRQHPRLYRGLQAIIRWLAGGQRPA